MSARDRQVELLGNIPLFRGCSRRELQRIAALMTEMDFPEGAVLTREGEPGREAFLIADGEVRVTLRGNELATLGSGQLFGEMSLLDLGPRAATTTALTPVHAYVLNPEEFASLLADAPLVSRKLLRELASRLRAVENASTH